VNIFYLHETPKTCAEMHCDRHVLKMIIEYAQLMSTAHRVLDGEEYYALSANGRKIKRWRMSDSKYENGLMKASHVHHPSNVWVRQSRHNYMWLNQMWNYLLLEYTHRYGKRHACADRMEVLYAWPENIPDVPFTPPTPAMPDECKIANNSLASYHKYYIEKKVRFARWTNREAPLWFQNEINKNNANLQLL
jgi:hypothetical protein